MSTPGAAHGLAALSLAELQAFDPQGGQGGDNQRFLCPLCGVDKPRDFAHRCLIVHAHSGAWNCKRCGARGKLRERWSAQSTLAPFNQQTRTRDAACRAFGIGAPSDRKNQLEKPGRNQVFQVESTLVPAGAPAWRQRLRGLVPLANTPGAKYFESRGVPLEIAHQAGARFSSAFHHHRPAVVFPIRDAQSTLIAAQGRFVDGRDNPKAITYGPKKYGVFLTPGALGRMEGAPLIVTEAPIDALSLAAVGFPALALCGTSGPPWLHRAGAFRRVMLAFDADEAGDRAAHELAPDLETFGARCSRLRPEGGKDWNEILCTIGAPALCDWLALRVLVD